MTFKSISKYVWYVLSKCPLLFLVEHGVGEPEGKVAGKERKPEKWAG